MLSVEFGKMPKKAKTMEEIKNSGNSSEESMANFNMGLTKTVNLDLDEKNEEEKKDTKSKFSHIIQNMTTKGVEEELANIINKKMDKKLKLQRRKSHQPNIKRQTQLDFKKNKTNTTILENNNNKKESLSM